MNDAEEHHATLLKDAHHYFLEQLLICQSLLKSGLLAVGQGVFQEVHLPVREVHVDVIDIHDDSGDGQNPSQQQAPGKIAPNTE